MGETKHWYTIEVAVEATEAEFDHLFEQVAETVMEPFPDSHVSSVRKPPEWMDDVDG